MTFLRGDKDYLLGVKGSGKSSVFRQLVDRKIEFRNTKKLNQILVPIDQEIDYLAVKNHLHKSLQVAIVDEDVRARYVWEIYVLYRVIVTVLDFRRERGQSVCLTHKGA